MLAEINDFFTSLPPLTRYWFGGTIALSLIGRFQLIHFYWLYLDYDLFIHEFQLWRAVTSVFYYPMSFHLLINLYLLYSYSLRLETGHFVRKPADYLFMLLFVWVCCLIVGLCGLTSLLMVPMVMAVVYVWCQMNPEAIVSFWFGITFKAMYLPWVLLAFRFIVEQGGKPELIGIIVGHLYFFLTIKYPQDFGGTPLLHTPEILYRVLPNQAGISGFGRAPTAPRPQGGMAGGGGGAAGGGGGGVRGIFRGQGHTLG